MEGMTLIAYLVISLGGSRKRQAGWKVLVVLHAIVAILLGAGMSIIVSYFKPMSILGGSDACHTNGRNMCVAVSTNERPTSITLMIDFSPDGVSTRPGSCALSAFV